MLYIVQITETYKMNINTLVIIMRTDLDSLNPGKAMAQAAHASNHAVARAKEDDWDISEWELSTDQSFGTTLVYGGTWKEIMDFYSYQKQTSKCGIIHDPTYPLRDGSYTHSIPLDTCVWFWASPDNNIIAEVSNRFRLHP